VEAPPMSRAPRVCVGSDDWPLSDGCPNCLNTQTNHNYIVSGTAHLSTYVIGTYSGATVRTVSKCVSVIWRTHCTHCGYHSKSLYYIGVI